MRLLRFIASDQPRYGIILDGEDEIIELATSDPFAELSGGPSAVSGAVDPTVASRKSDAGPIAKNSPGKPPAELAVAGALTELERTGRQFALSDVRLLAPVAAPSKIVGVGKNYAEHIKEFDSFTPEEPLIFLKPTTALIGPGDPIILPSWSQKVDHEAELAVVIGKTAKNVPMEAALSYVLGYTVGNDVSARDIQKRDGQWTRAKGFDTACPLGPWIAVEPELDPTDLLVTSKVNDALKQSASTATMLHPVAELVSFISHAFTLLPGDVILTGTPAGVSQLHGGDLVEVAVAGVGALTNPVVGEN